MEKETKNMYMLVSTIFIRIYVVKKLSFYWIWLMHVHVWTNTFYLKNNNTSMHKYSKAVVFVFIWVKGSVMIFNPINSGLKLLVRIFFFGIHAHVVALQFESTKMDHLKNVSLNWNQVQIKIKIKSYLSIYRFKYFKLLSLQTVFRKKKNRC